MGKTVTKKLDAAAPAATPEPTPVDLGPVDEAVVTTLAAGIKKEVAEDGKKHSSLDRDAIRSNPGAILRRVSDLLPALVTFQPDGTPKFDAGNAPTVVAYQHLIARSLARLDPIVVSHPTTAVANKVYSAEAHKASKKAYVPFARARTRISDRLGTDAVDRAIKNECAVGATVAADAPLEVRDRGLRMIASLEKPENQIRFADRGVNVGALLFPLKAAVTPLAAAIKKGSDDKSRSQSNDEIDKELLFLDVAFSRLFGFLGDHLTEEEPVVKIRGDVPRNFSRRAGDPKKEKPQDGTTEEVAKPAET